MTDQTQAMTPDEAAAAAAAERPAHRRSIFFDHQARIRELLAEGRSYRQILCMLRLKHMSRSVLARWCERQGLHSTATSSGPRAGERMDKKSALPAGPAAANAASEPALPAAPNAPAASQAKSISDLIAEDEAAQRAELARFFKPKSE